MPSVSRWTFRVFAPAVAGVGILLAFAVATDWFTVATDRAIGYDRDFEKRFRGIEVGMNQQMVIEVLGPPHERSPTFFLGQREGFESSFARAAESDAVEYLVWRSGVDVVFSVGVDPSGKVVVAEYGGT